MEKKLIKLYVAIDKEQDKLLTQEQDKLKKKLDMKYQNKAL